TTTKDTDGGTSTTTIKFTDQTVNGATKRVASSGTVTGTTGDGGTTSGTLSFDTAGKITQSVTTTKDSDGGSSTTTIKFTDQTVNGVTKRVASSGTITGT